MSCGARDVPLQTLKEKLTAGEVVYYNTIGERPPTCSEKSSDWQTVSIHEKDYDFFVLNEMKSLMKNGYKNCHRVGQRVYVSNNKIKTNGSLGWAEVTGIALVNLETLNKNSNNNSSDYSKKKRQLTKGKLDLENFDVTINRLMLATRPEHQGIAHVTFLKYIPESSSLEPQIKAKWSEVKIIESQLLSGVIIAISQPGLRLPSCSATSKTWVDFRINQYEAAMLKKGKIETFIKRGLKNCHEINQVIPIKVESNDVDTANRVRIVELSLLTLETLKSNRNLIRGESSRANIEKELTHWEQELKEDNDKFISLIYAEWLGGQND